MLSLRSCIRLRRAQVSPDSKTLKTSVVCCTSSFLSFFNFLVCQVSQWYLIGSPMTWPWSAGTFLKTFEMQLQCRSPSWDTEHVNRNKVSSAGSCWLQVFSMIEASTYTVTGGYWGYGNHCTVFTSLMRLSKTKGRITVYDGRRHRPHIRHICLFLHSFVTWPVPSSQSRNAFSLIGLETGNLAMPWNSSLQTRHGAFGVNREAVMDVGSLDLALVLSSVIQNGHSFNRSHGLCTAFLRCQKSL